MSLSNKPLSNFSSWSGLLNVDMHADGDEEELSAYVRYTYGRPAGAVRSFDGIEFHGEFMEVSLHAWNRVVAPDLD